MFHEEPREILAWRSRHWTGPTETWVSVCPEPEAEVSSCVHTKFGHNPLAVDGKVGTGSGSEWLEGVSVG